MKEVSVWGGAHFCGLHLQEPQLPDSHHEDPRKTLGPLAEERKACF